MNTEEVAQLFVLLLAKFPEFDPKWSGEFQDKWFEIFQQLLELVRQLEAHRPR
jgi:hypothetical protein